jgi:hypothetical protein
LTTRIITPTKIRCKAPDYKLFLPKSQKPSFFPLPPSLSLSSVAPLPQTLIFFLKPQTLFDLSLSSIYQPFSLSLPLSFSLSPVAPLSLRPSFFKRLRASVRGGPLKRGRKREREGEGKGLSLSKK